MRKDTIKSVFLYSILISLLIIPVSLQIPILVNIKESLEGYFPYFNYTIGGDIISIEAVWENIGSITCDTYLRLKIISKDLERDFWSEKVNVPPGGVGILRVYSFLPKEDMNNITIIPYFYYCNEIKKLRNISLINYNSTGKHIANSNVTGIKEKINISYVVLDKNKAIFKFKINQSPNNISFKELYIIPNSPRGWILPTKKIILNKNQSFINLTYSFYKPERTPCCTDFLFVLKDSEDQYFYVSHNINLTHTTLSHEKAYSFKDIVLFFSIILNVVLLVWILTNLYKIKRA